MGQEFRDAVGTDEWDVLDNAIAGSRVTSLKLFHTHPASDTVGVTRFWVDDKTQCCRVCEKRAPDFVWFRYKTWNLRHLTQ